MRPIALPLAAMLASCAAPAWAVVTRHDVADQAYRRKAAELPSYCRMMAPDGGGALIAPYWVITAAHLAPELAPGHRFRCGAEELVAAEIVTHPRYRDEVGRHDLALVRLAAPSRQRPLALWREPLAAGSLVNLIGHWQGGTGLTGATAQASKALRGATNIVASADPHWLRFTLDPPPAATPLEGVSGGGDSGAPAYLVRAGRAHVAGVGSRSADTNEDGVEQNYGDTDLYVPVVSHLSWIDRVVEGRETPLTRALLRHRDWWTAAAIAAVALPLILLLRRRKRRRAGRA